MADQQQRERDDQVVVTDDQVVVTRDVDLDVPAERLWDLVADGSTWAGWLGRAADVDVAEGTRGAVVDDDGVVRRVRIDRVDHERGLRFTWWPEGEEDRPAAVELVVVPRPGGSRLRVREVWAQASADRAVASQRAWDLRALVLWSMSARLQPV